MSHCRSVGLAACCHLLCLHEHVLISSLEPKLKLKHILQKAELPKRGLPRSI